MVKEQNVNVINFDNVKVKQPAEVGKLKGVERRGDQKGRRYNNTLILQSKHLRISVSY